MALSATGEILAQIPQFADQVIVVASDGEPTELAYFEPMRELYDALVLGLRDYAAKCGELKDLLDDSL